MLAFLKANHKARPSCFRAHKLLHKEHKGSLRVPCACLRRGEVIIVVNFLLSSVYQFTDTQPTSPLCDPNAADRCWPVLVPGCSVTGFERRSFGNMIFITCVNNRKQNIPA